MAYSEEKRPHVETERMQEFKKASYRENINGSQKLLKCPQPGCNKVLTSAPGLRYHIKTHFGIEAPYACTKCKKIFKSANGLRYHTEKTRCEDCTSSALGAEVDLTSGFEMQRAGQHQSFASAEENDDVDILDSNSHPPVIDVSLWKTSSPPDCVLDDLALSPTPYRTALSFHKQEEIVSPLTQLAFIATSPQSPLISSYGSMPSTRGYFSHYSDEAGLQSSIHSYAKPPRGRGPPVSWKRSLSFSTPSLCTLSSEGSSSEEEVKHSLRSSSTNGLGSSGATCYWPLAAWHCFLPGTKVRIENGQMTNWKLVEDVDQDGRPPFCYYAPHGLRLSEMSEEAVEEVAGCSGSLLAVAAEAPALLFLRFVSASADEEVQLFTQCQTQCHNLHALCALDHPFFVKEKGWCSCSPTATEERYHIPCLELELNDICLPPSHPDAAFTIDALHSFEIYDFTPEESSAVFTLNSMAKKRDHGDCEVVLSQSYPLSTLKEKLTKGDSVKAKRPMNAFMLFAKKFRVEYTQLYPGKDNRAISVLLGDRWKKMRNDERKTFAQEAKLLAEQHKKLHPDCWKRKRSASESCIS